MSEDLPSRILVHQCLHGYVDGHRLVETSVPLPDDAQSALLVLTDLPEGVPPSGFAPFLTGYPLPGTSHYALARTWHAQEMRRPGCVWTHTLLIAFADLARVQDLTGLLSLHTRPASPDFHSYGSPSVLPSDSLPLDHRSLSCDLLRNLLVALYGTPTALVRLESKNDTESEQIVMQLWSQQWPRLRRSFSFRTAISTGGAVKTRGFDLVRSEIQGQGRTSSSPIAIKTHAVQETSQCDEFFRLAKDIQEPGKLRRLLWAFGADAGGRSACIPLVRIFDWLEKSVVSTSETVDAITALLGAFPKPDQVSLLRNALLNRPNDETASLISPSHRFAVLEAYCENTQLEVLGATPDAIHAATDQLWETHRTNLIDLAARLLSASTTPSRDALLDRVFGKIDPGDLKQLDMAHRGFVYALIIRRPSLAGTPNFWRVSRDVQEEVLWAIKRAECLSDSDLRAVLGALIEAGVSHAAESLAYTFRDRFVSAIFSILADQRELPENWNDDWRRSIATNQSAVEEWLRTNGISSPALAAAALPALSSPDRIVDIVDTSKLLNLVSLLPISEKSAYVDVQALLLAAGLRARSVDGRRIACVTFQQVYNAAKHSCLSSSIVDRLDRVLPSLGFWRDWDLCRRLCAALAQAFIDDEWDSQLLLSAAPESETFHRVLQEAVQSRRGKKWVTRFVEQCVNHLDASPEQREILRKL